MAWNFQNELSLFGPESPRLENRGLRFSRDYCRSVCQSHYENFSVASLLLPRHLRSHFHAIYAYCRWSDDLADETGDRDTALSLLAWWRNELQLSFENKSNHPVMIALHDTVTEFSIPPEPFLNLLTAFEQDQRVNRYDSFEQLLGYCRNSANPVGHLVLYLFRSFDPARAELSDHICTGLQLANFWQDVARDSTIDRLYLPKEDLARFGYSQEDWRANRFTPAFRELMTFEVDRTRQFFERGKPLLAMLPHRLRCNIDLFILGGEAVLAGIERVGYDVWKTRPVVSKWQKLKILSRASFGLFG